MKRKSAPPQARALRETAHFVIYGVSRKYKGYGFDVAAAIAKMRPDANYTFVHPVPEAFQDREFTGTTNAQFAKSASAVRDPRKCMAVIALAAGDAEIALRDAISAGIGKIWLAMNASTEETRLIASRNGRAVYSGCPILFVDKPDGFHAFHKWLAKLFGKA